MLVALLIVAVLGAILCVLWQINESTVGYVPKLKAKPGRHRATHRAVGLSTAQLSQAAALEAARKTARIHAEYETWLDSIAPTERVDELDFRPAVDHRYDVLAIRALDAKAHLERKGLRLRSSQFGTPELDDVWEPDLVGAR